MTIQLRASDFNAQGNSGETTFMSNDIVILTSERMTSHTALKGKLRVKNNTYIDTHKETSSLILATPDLDTRKNGFLGQVEQYKRSIDGLCLKISKKLWVAAGSPEMYLVKIGSNVTGKFQMKCCDNNAYHSCFYLCTILH